MAKREPQILLRDRRLYIVFGITLIGVMGVASITPAFPQIARELDLDSRQVGLLISVFTFPGIVLAPVLGFLSDRVGRKAVLVPALLLFAAAGMACGVVSSFPLLLLFRFFQGMGAASLTSLSITLLGDSYDGDRRKAAVGYNASALSIGTAAYPVLGGLLAAFAWRAPFFLSGAAIPVAYFVVTALKVPAVSSQDGFREHLRDTVKNAWRGGILTLSLLAVLIFLILYGAYLAYLPFLLSERAGATSAGIGAIMSGMSLATAITSSRYGALARRFAVRGILALAFLLYAAAFLALPLLYRWWTIGLLVLVYGVAQGLAIPAIHSEMAARASTRLRGASLSVNTVATRIGQTLGPLAMGAVYAAADITAVFYLAAAISGASLLLLLRLPGGRPRGQMTNR